MENILNIFKNEVFIILMSTGICIWLVCIYVLRNPPESVNGTYGYRTPASMKSQEAWDHAQLHGTRRMLVGSQALCCLALLSIFLHLEELIGVGVAVTAVLLALFIPLYITERELKDMF